MKRKLPAAISRLVTFGIITGTRMWAADDWPEFRGPTGQGLANAANVPVHWSATSNVVWKTAIPGEGWSSPVLSDGRLYLTLGQKDGSTGETSLRTVCLDTKDGHIAWNVEALRPDATKATELHKNNSLASSTPILDNKRLYAHFGQMGTTALDLNGKVLWQQTNIVYPSYHGNGGSPALIDGLLMFNCDGKQDPFIIALDAKTGDIRWRTPRNAKTRRPWSFATPLVIQIRGKTQIISPGSGYVGAYDPKDGSEIWRVNYGEGHSVIPRPVFAHGLLFFSSGFVTPTVFAVNPDGASGDVTSSHVAWTHTRSGPKIPSPLVVGDEIYFISEAGVVSCLDARTGKEHWSERLEGNFSASPVSAGGRLYFQSEEGVGYVLKAGKTFDRLAKNELQERTKASPALADNRIYLRSESHLWCIGK